MASMSQIGMMADSRRYAGWIAPVVLGAVAMYGWLIWPHVNHLHAVQRLEPVVERVAEETGRIHGGLDRKRERLSEMQRQCSSIRECLFTAGESRSLLHDLHSRVAQSGCALVTATVVPEKDGQQDAGLQMVDDIQAILTVQGRYDQIAAMLEALRDGRRKIWVNTCSLQLSDPTAGRFECQLEVTAFAAVGPETE